MSLVSIYSTDPRGNKIGGIETHVNDYLKYAQSEIKFVGIDTIGDKIIGKWTTININSKTIPFFPVLFESNVTVNKQQLLPLTVRFVLKLFQYRNKIVSSKDILDFQRIEHMIPFILTRNKYNIFQFIHGSSAHLLTKTGTSIEKYRHIYLLIENILLKYCNKIFLVSHESYNYYRNRYLSISNKFIELSSSVDTINFRSEKNNKYEWRKTFNIPEDAKVVSFVGRIHGVKDPKLLFESFKKVLNLEPKALLCIAGPGKLEDFIERTNENDNYLKNVMQFGILVGEQLNRFYNCMDVFLLTSKYEGMPRSVLEALWVGIPVVSVVVGSIKLLIKNEYNGFVVESRDPNEIGIAIKRAIDLQPYLSENASKSVAKYSSKDIIGSIIKIQLES